MTKVFAGKRLRLALACATAQHRLKHFAISPLRFDGERVLRLRQFLLEQTRPVFRVERCVDGAPHLHRLAEAHENFW